MLRSLIYSEIKLLIKFLNNFTTWICCHFIIIIQNHERQKLFNVSSERNLRSETLIRLAAWMMMIPANNIRHANLLLIVDKAQQGSGVVSFLWILKSFKGIKWEKLATLLNLNRLCWHWLSFWHRCVPISLTLYFNAYTSCSWIASKSIFSENLIKLAWRQVLEIIFKFTSSSTALA